MGIQWGKLNQLVDPLPFVQSVSNVTESGGGADEEDDDSYAERIRQAPESFSVAGPIWSLRVLGKVSQYPSRGM
ncbi:baseplate J/gp47 family protein [Brevibacillus brevis]|uniref:baseplate J/gp47 family protein n=1 Tax=Brevibacillus brevis TaxID=1393 RepID=UPI003645F46F